MCPRAYTKVYARGHGPTSQRMFMLACMRMGRQLEPACIPAQVHASPHALGMTNVPASVHESVRAWARANEPAHVQARPPAHGLTNVPASVHAVYPRGDWHTQVYPLRYDDDDGSTTRATPDLALGPRTNVSGPLRHRDRRKTTIPKS